ncbi:helix-turn-helix domain-containing protein [Staphylococcus hyicus]|uniref:helix-turn-helix domain-containing protein n=1 Tax=Staphylococcus hyicus TaxID=1284 RepID=UPI00208E7201|nr:helix-turn-helix transcriptional regulator [Staphylococcus hyicus]MCO4332604.1 helix-turn-helix domain-containing protein [Staphylococcus hyicus]MCO4332930.1 helix-turn-helix domain-containing protein [Staphylococcus hyicus]
MEVGHHIKAYRTAMAMSQSDLAEKIYVSSQTISNWENERSYPDLQNLIYLSEVFNVSLDQLVRGDVEEMKHNIDSSNIERYGNIMVISMFLTAVSFAAALKYSEGWFGFLGPFVIWLISMYSAIKVDKIKKKHDVKTYKEIVDYMENGKKTITKERHRFKNGVETVGVVTGVVSVFLLITLISIWLFNILPF